MEGSIAFGSSISDILTSKLSYEDHFRPISAIQLRIFGNGGSRWSPRLAQSSCYGVRWNANNKRPMFFCKARQADSTDESESPTGWKEWKGERIDDGEFARQGISIRRHPPAGPSSRKDNDTDAPCNILEEIVWSKNTEVAQMKEKMSFERVKQALRYAAPPKDFIAALVARAEETGLPALIAEVKKASPSRGVIQPDFDPSYANPGTWFWAPLNWQVQIAQAYEKGGAACLSVLTDSKYFQGSFENLQAIQDAGIQCPLLCKEFVIDPYQLYYARLKGADAVLLIAAVLSDQEIKYLKTICRNLGMAALVEVHSIGELDRVLGLDGIELIGINNRDLGTFEVDIHNTEQLLQGGRIQTIRNRNIIVVGESGLFTPDDIALVQRAGARAVLVGESIVKQSNPAAGIAELFGKDISRRPEMQTIGA